jgi:hypothetical protein
MDRLEVSVDEDASGKPKSVRLVFGPHYFVDVRSDDGRMTFVLGATHHGFKADASDVGGELESFVNEIRDRHPANAVD